MHSRNRRQLCPRSQNNLKEAVVPLANETRLREHMHVTTDKGTWRVDFEGEPSEEGHFRLYRCPAGGSNLTEWPEKFAGNPDGMVQIVGVIEAEDARKLGGQVSAWQIYFDAHAETERRSWTLPWLPTDADLSKRLFEELERGEL